MIMESVDDELKAQLLKLTEMHAPEELHPELARYIVQLTYFEAIQHPLVYSVPYNAMMNKMVNMRFEQVKKSLAQALEKGDYEKAVWLHERPHRFDAFLQFMCEFTPEKYWKVLGSIWTDTENAFQNQDMWLEVWQCDLSHRDKCMSEHELEFYKNLPEKIVAYRGTEKNHHGLSWTLDKKRAEFFSRRYTKNGFVLEATIDKSNVLAYFSGRNESEIVVVPKTFKMKKIK